MGKLVVEWLGAFVGAVYGEKDGIPVGDVVGILVGSFLCREVGACPGNSDCRSVGIVLWNGVGGVVGDLIGV